MKLEQNYNKSNSSQIKLKWPKISGKMDDKC